MRTLVLAKLFKDQGHHVAYCCQALKGNKIEWIRKKGIEVYVLESNSVSNLTQIINTHKVDLLIIDHYKIGFEEEYIISTTNDCQLMVLDDLYKKHHCDILLNHNISGNPDRYHELVPKNCLVLAGPRYALIRKEFRAAEIPDRSLKKENSINCFIALGGTDPTNLSSTMIDLLQDIKQCQFNIFTTSSNANLDLLKSKASNYKNFTLHIDENNLATFMKSADIAIVSPSVSSIEVIFMELPFIAIKVAENQQNTYLYLKKHQLPVFEAAQLEKIKSTFLEMFDKNIYAARYKKVKEIKTKNFKADKKSIYELITTRAYHKAQNFRDHHDIRKGNEPNNF